MYPFLIIQLIKQNKYMWIFEIPDLALYCHKSTVAPDSSSMPDKKESGRQERAREAEREPAEDLPILLNSWWEMKMTWWG